MVSNSSHAEHTGMHLIFIPFDIPTHYSATDKQRNIISIHDAEDGEDLEYDNRQVGRQTTDSRQTTDRETEYTAAHLTLQYTPSSPYHKYQPLSWRRGHGEVRSWPSKERSRDENGEGPMTMKPLLAQTFTR